MTTQEILNILQSDIHSVVFATLDEHGLPQTCVIDLMLADDDGLYFLTAKGKAFYRRLMAKPFVSISGMKGGDTLSTTAISVRGAVRSIGIKRLAEIFEKNPYMAKIYPTEKAGRLWKCFSSTKVRANISTLPSFRPIARAFPSAVSVFRKTAIALFLKNVSAARAAGAFAR